MRLGRIGGVLVALALAVAPAAPAAAQGAYPPGLTADTLRLATAGPPVVAAGGAHSCTITSLGDAYCWGDDSSGQLGDGPRPHGFGRPVVALRNAVQLDAGRAHTCGIDARGAALCWGDDSAGQLGDGGRTDRDVARRVRGLDGRTLVDIATGSRHTCALDDEGAAWCWGDGAKGQLGVPGLGGSTTPARVSLADPVVDLAAGGDTTCAATAGGVAYCWGAGVPGGDGRRPTAVRTDGKVRQVAVGGQGPCALATEGDATCWDPKAGTTGALAAITAGGRHTCGLRRDGRAWCRGAGADGRLGYGGTADRPAAVRVAAGAPLVAVDAGTDHTCAADSHGYTSCWGAGQDGQLGAGSTGASGVPVRVEGLPRAPTAVTGLQVRALDGGLRVSWRPPADLGSGRLEYLWATTAGHETGCTLTSLTVTGCELRNLRNGQEYDVTVVVRTSDGVTVSDYVTAAPAAVAPDLSGTSRTPQRELQPGASDGLPVTGLSPAALVAIGTMLLGGGLVALLVRKQ